MPPLEKFFHVEILPGSDINTALNNSYKEDSSECLCTVCNSVNKHIISRTIFDHPRVLLVLVKRYANSSSYARSTRDCRKVLVGNTLDILGQKYTLGGCVVHRGASVNKGHYISCVMIQGQWYVCNDSSIQKVRSLPDESRDAYLLFFIKHQSA